MYVGNMAGNAPGGVRMQGPILKKLKKRWNKFKKMTGKEKWKRIGKAALLGPLVAPAALVAAPVAMAVMPVVGTAKLLKKASKKSKFMKVLSQSLIPGIGPIMATATAAKMGIAARNRAKAAAAAAEGAAEYAAPGEFITTPEQEAEIQAAENEESMVDVDAEEKKKQDTNNLLTIGAIAVGAKFLLPMIL